MSSEFEEVARDLGLRAGQVERTLALSEDGATVPFIARYRKEATGAWTRSRCRRCWTASGAGASWRPAGRP